MSRLKLLYGSVHTLVLASAVLVVDVGALLSPSGLGGVPAGKLAGPEGDVVAGGIHLLLAKQKHK